jgi:hypothetical protein
VPENLSDVVLDGVYDRNNFTKVTWITLRFGRESVAVVLRERMTPEQVAEKLLDLATQLESIK